jgi:hypothetical protein
MPPCVAYLITRLEDGSIRAQVKSPRKPYSALRHICYHSPTGFEVGYGGSGPADLALSILSRHFRETAPVGIYPQRGRRSRAWHYHQQFKADILAAIELKPGQNHVITSLEIDRWLAAQPTKET